MSQLFACRSCRWSSVGRRPRRTTLQLLHVQTPWTRPRLRLLPGRRRDRKHPDYGAVWPRTTTHVPDVGRGAERHGTHYAETSIIIEMWRILSQWEQTELACCSFGIYCVLLLRLCVCLCLFTVVWAKSVHKYCWVTPPNECR